MSQTHRSLEDLDPADFGIGVLFGSIGEAVVVGDAETEQIVLWNPAAERIFGYAADEIVGRPIHTLIPDRLQSDHRNGLRRYAETGDGPFIGTEISVDLPAVRKDGTEIEVALTLTPVDTAKKKGRFALAMIRDVTYRRKLEEELRRASDRLRELDQLRNDFVAMVVHDLRTPLTVIQATLALIQQNGAALGEERVAELVDRSLISATQASNLLGDVLTVAQIENDTFVVHPARLDVAKVVYEAVDVARETAPDLHFDVRIQDDVPAAFADERRVMQVLNNLLSNAVKFSPSHSTVTVDVAVAGSEIHVSVIDEGVGIPPDAQERIFAKYERVQPHEARHAKGTGLGLFISKSLIDAQGGRMWVKSRAGEGATFTFSLPIAQQRRPQGDLDEVRKQLIGHNEALFREVNEGVAAESSSIAEGITFLCECGDSSCAEPLRLHQVQYEAVRAHGSRFVVLPGHDIPGAEEVVETHDDYVVVEKVGRARQDAEQRDPRGPDRQN